MEDELKTCWLFAYVIRSRKKSHENNCRYLSKENQQWTIVALLSHCCVRVSGIRHFDITGRARTAGILYPDYVR